MTSKFRLTLTGTRPIIMHSDRLADVFDPIAKEKAVVSAKRKKTDEDHMELARLEWLGGIYFDEDAGPYLPADNIFKALVEAARKSKQGKQVEQGLLIETEINPLAYHGPRDLDSLWEDQNFVFRRSVKQQQSRIMRTRPIFRDWRVDVEGEIDPAVLNMSDVQEFATIAGHYIGVGDWRPRYGRFTAEVESI